MKLNCKNCVKIRVSINLFIREECDIHNRSRHINRASFDETTIVLQKYKTAAKTWAAGGSMNFSRKKHYSGNATYFAPNNFIINWGLS